MRQRLRSLAFAATTCAALACTAFAAAAADTSNDSTHVHHLEDRLKHDAAQPTTDEALRQITERSLPTVALHTEFVVETNAKGQVARVRSGKPSNNQVFNAQTYGNALQTYIRTDTGHADAGLFRITYDYSPKTKTIRRDVTLISKGGVNPNALGAVYQMQQDQAAAARRKSAKH